LVVAEVTLEAVLGALAFTSAAIRETESQAHILMLQREMLPRHVDIYLHAIGPLEQFAGMPVMIRSVEETESRRLLFDFVQLLNKARWQTNVRPEQPLSFVPDGVEIVYRTADSKGQAEKAARALSTYLNLPAVKIENEVNAFPSQTLWQWWPSNSPTDSSPLRLEPRSVTIFIGLRPVGDRQRNWFQPEKP